MRTLTAGLLCAVLACPAAAHVEKQFELPDFLRQPFYDVEIEAGPLLDLENIKPDNVLSLNHIGRMLKCVVPEVTTNATVQPLTDEATISQARAVLDQYKNTTLLYLDDVWGWHFAFDEDIVQFFPEEGPEPGTFHLSASSFQVHIGKNDNYPGHVSLDDAYPVVVDDQHMLYTRFVNGTQCDLTMEPRLANVYFACSLDAEPDVPLVLSIDEPYSCTYEFVIGIRELCDIEAFRSHEVPVNIIRCGTDPDFVDESVDNEDSDSDSELHLTEESYDPVHSDSLESQSGEEHFESENESESESTVDPDSQHSVLDSSYDSPDAPQQNDDFLDENSGEAVDESVNMEGDSESHLNNQADPLENNSSETAHEPADVEGGPESRPNHQTDPNGENSSETQADTTQAVEPAEVEERYGSETYTDNTVTDDVPLSDDSEDQVADTFDSSEANEPNSEELPEHNEL